MRFTCPKCGKKYASSAEPAPGKAYRLKCKACGEPIVLRAGGIVGSATPAPGTLPVAPAAAPERPASPTAAEASPPRPLPEPTPASISIPSVTPTPAALGPPPPAPPPAPPDDTSLDLDQLLADTGPPSGGPSSGTDPFAAAARASLPDGYGASGGAPDPIAALTREPGAEAPSRREIAPPSFASIPKPPRQRSGVAVILLLAAGLLALMAVLGYAILRGQGSDASETAAPKPPAAARPVP